MPGLTDDPFPDLSFLELHPTFGAEVEGVDFSRPISEGLFQQILAASVKASTMLLGKAHTRS
jgi:hypothetical protein